jgi:hypothetical protein
VNKRILLSISFLILVILTSAVKPDPIRLIQGNTILTRPDFYVSKVIDDRIGQPLFASLYLSKPGIKPAQYPTDLQGGTLESVRNFILNGVSKNPSGRPLVIHIKACKITESLSAENRVSGNIMLVFQFNLQKEWGEVSLTQYSASIKYTRTIDDLTVLEPSLRRMLTHSLKYIDNWINKEASQNIHLAKGVNISFSDYLEQDPDTVYYESSRPLTWNDFRQKAPASNRFMAAVSTSFGYDFSSKMKDGIIHIDLSIKVGVAKSASWATSGIRNDYSLNHEQKHFDLVKVIAGKFRNKLKSEKLTPDNYEGIINVEYLEFYREMNKIQIRYDDETSHGMNKSKQEEWNRRIESELSEMLN